MISWQTLPGRMCKARDGPVYAVEGGKWTHLRVVLEMRGPGGALGAGWRGCAGRSRGGSLNGIWSG